MYFFVIPPTPILLQHPPNVLLNTSFALDIRLSNPFRLDEVFPHVYQCCNLVRLVKLVMLLVHPCFVYILLDSSEPWGIEQSHNMFQRKYILHVLLVRHPCTNVDALLVHHLSAKILRASYYYYYYSTTTSYQVKEAESKGP